MIQDFLVRRMGKLFKARNKADPIDAWERKPAKKEDRTDSR